MNDPIQLKQEDADALGSVLIDAFDQAEADRGDYIQQLEDNRELFQNVQERDNMPFENACTLHIPLLRYTSNALAARQVRALLGQELFIFVEGRSPLAQQLATPVENFLKLQFKKQLHWRDIWRPVIQEANDDGTSVTYYRWKTTVEKKLHYVTETSQDIDELTGQPLGPPKQKTTQKRIPVVTYDGPDVQRLPIDMVGTYPAAMGDIQESQGVYVCFTETGSELLNRAANNEYDKDAVEKIRAGWKSTGSTRQRKRSDDKNAGVDISDASVNVDLTFHNTPYEITEWYWRYPVAENEPAEDWLITLATRDTDFVVLRAIPNPWGHGKRPIVVSRILPAKYGIIGTSIADISGNTQQLMTKLIRNALDSMDWRTNPVWAFGAGVTPDEYKKLLENLAPGYKFRTNSDDLNKAIQQFGMIGIDPNQIIPLYELLNNTHEKALLSDTLAGGQTQPGTTATEITKMVTEGQEVILDMIDTLSESQRQAAEFILELDYQFATHESIEELWQLANPGIGIPAYIALAESYDLEAAGTRQTSNAALKRQMAIEKFTALADNPFEQVDPTGKLIYARHEGLLVDGFADRQPEAIIGKEEDAANIAMAQQAAQLLAVAQQMQQMQQAAGGTGDGQSGEVAGAGGMAGASAMPGLGETGAEVGY